jgi:hypothetical protein
MRAIRSAAAAFRGVWFPSFVDAGARSSEPDFTPVPQVCLVPSEKGRCHRAGHAGRSFFGFSFRPPGLPVWRDKLAQVQEVFFSKNSPATFLLVLEAGYFVWALAGDKDLEKADLIVSFEGAYDRARAAYSLVDRSYAHNLLISPATEKKLRVYEKRFNPSQPYDRVMEDKSRTTLENAVHTGQIIGENGFNPQSWSPPGTTCPVRTSFSGSSSRCQGSRSCSTLWPQAD